MSKEAYRGDDCACGQRIAFMQYHWPNCPMNPDNMSTKTHGAGDALLTSLQATFTKAELKQIAWPDAG